MGTAVQTRATGKQTIAIADMADIILGAACRYDGTCTAIFPQIQVMLGVKCNHTTTGGATGGLNADTIGQRLCQQAIGILILQVILGDKGQLVQILHTMDILRLYACCIHFIAVKFYIVIYILYLLDQTLALQCLQLVYRHGLNFRLIIMLHNFLRNSFCFSHT